MEEKAKYKLPYLSNYHYRFYKHYVFYYGIAGAVLMEFLVESIKFKRQYNIDKHDGKYWIREDEIAEFTEFDKHQNWEAILNHLCLNKVFTNTMVSPSGNIVNIFTVSDDLLL